MSIAQAALAKAKKLRESQGGSAPKKTTSTSAKKSTTKTKRVSTRGASDAEKAQVVKMFNAGKPVSEITEAMGWKKAGDWPNYYTLGVIRQLRKAGRLGYHREPEKKSKTKK